MKIKEILRTLHHELGVGLPDPLVVKAEEDESH